MSFADVEQIARAVLYEGYLLYPYRASALKNRQRWMFGRLVSRDAWLALGESDPWMMQTECLIVGTPQMELEVRLRFLQWVASDDASDAPETPDLGPEDPLDTLDVPHLSPGDTSPTYLTAVERDVTAVVRLPQIANRTFRVAFGFEPRLEGTLSLTATEAGGDLIKVTVVIENHTPIGAGEGLDRMLLPALLPALISTHTILHVRDGEFISLLDPPDSCRAAKENCRNIGTWPVLVGPEPGKMMLSGPIILYDYPRVAPESPGDLFDGTEIDELLALRIQTLTDNEKRQMSAAGEHARRILERTQTLTDESSTFYCQLPAAA